MSNPNLSSEYALEKSTYRVVKMGTKGMNYRTETRDEKAFKSIEHNFNQGYVMTNILYKGTDAYLIFEEE